jgi:hypothetical protein
MFLDHDLKSKKKKNAIKSKSKSKCDQKKFQDKNFKKFGKNIFYQKMGIL